MNAALPPESVAQRSVSIIENVPIARDTYRLRLYDPAMAVAIRPGQFLMIRPAPGLDPLLGRPFALYDVDRDDRGTPTAIDVVYLVLGRGTAALAQRRPGDRLEVWGPLGNGFPPPPAGPVLLVGGGIGQTPFLALARWWLGASEYGGSSLPPEARATSLTMLYGVRSAHYLAGLEDFQAAGVPVEIATNDGSRGHQGYVTDLLQARLQAGERPALVVGCGPAPMLAVLSRILTDAGVPGLLSLENHMACGFGACFSCVAPIRQADGSIDLRRVCVEGPIFDASAVAWPG